MDIVFLLAALVTFASSAEDKAEICTLFLNDNDIKQQLSSSGVATTACPCVETIVALDYSFRKINNCYQEWFYNDHGLKQMCCYSGSGNLLTGAPVGGYLSLKSYSENISKAHEACCHGNNSKCKLFYDINPSDDCSRYKQPDIVKSWGDPTITTLDKFVYDFNGHGEYLFLKTGNVEIQARTEYVTLGNTDATSFAAFVIYNSENDEQIELHFNKSSKMISIYNHGVYLGNSSRSPRSRLVPSKPLQCILIVGEDIVLLIGCALVPFLENIQFSAADYMSIEMDVDIRKTSKLNFTGLAQPRIDGNLVMRNGSLVNENISASFMFDFGESWALQSENESLFNYSITDKNFTSYNSDHTRPRFLEDLVGNLTALFPNAKNDTIDKYNETCRNYWNNEPNKQCLLTIARNGDYNLGVAIMKKENETQLIKEMTNNHRPSFNDDMPNKLKVTLTEHNSPYIIDLNNYVNDSDSHEVFRFTVETDIPQSDYELGDGEFQWTIKKSLRNTNTSLDINFHVFDKFNKTASHTMQIDLCGCEHGNSECDFTAENNASGIIAKCRCNKAYKGDFCEEIVDPCLLNSCYLDRCNHSAAVGEDPCEPCPDGYQGDGRACTDVDECEVTYNGTDKCEQNCTNTEGGFTCGCLPTYTLNDDKHSCSDIDECTNGSLICSNGTELCVNTIGSAHCACIPGYIRKASNGSCESVKDILQYAGSMNFSVTTAFKFTTSSEVNTIENREAINVEMDKWYKGTKNYVAVEVYLLQVFSSSRRRRSPGSDSAILEVDFIIYGSNGTATDIGAAIETSYNNYKTNHLDLETVITAAGAQISLRPGVVTMRLPNEFGMCNMTDRTDCNSTTTVCKNTDGGFECQCSSGYEKNTISTNQCFDIDECKLFKANSTSEQRCVQGICKNEVGTWTCDCPSDLERQRVGDASFPVYRCQGNYSYIGNASMLVRGTTNDTDINYTIERYLTDSYRNQSFEGKTFTVPISNLLVSTNVLTLRKEYTYTNGTMVYIAMFKLRMGEEVEVQRVADVLLKAVVANAFITGHSFNATILTNHIFTDEENMLCILSNNSDCDMSTTRCQQGNGTTSCQCLVGYERKDNTSCTVKNCGWLSNPDNGWVVLTNNQTIFNSSATFECNEGYRLDGDRGSICTSSGHWSSNASCSIWDCGTLTVENGEVTLVNNQTTFNASANIHCHIGYGIIGNTRSVCNDSGHWTDEPICEIKNCGILTKPMNGTVETDGNSTTYLSTANFSCDEGFKLSGQGFSTCESDGNWTHIPTCEIYDCGNLTVENGEVTLVNNKTTFNASANIHCHIGYDIIGNTRSVCNDSGHWTEEPICEIKNCGFLTKPMNGRIKTDGNTTTYLSTANFSCDEGYGLSGQGFSTCESDGNWTHIPTCEIYDCGPLVVPNGTVSIDGDRTTYNTVANISCETGFEYFGESQIVCNATGHWSAEANCTIKDCGNLTVENGGVTIVDNRTTFNASAYIQCHIGYNIIGNTSVCNASGYWSVEPICEITDCGILTKPMNGTVETDGNSTTYLSTANFSCDKGFYLSEKGVSTCESDGNWTQIPTCEIYDCGPLEVPNGTVSLDGDRTTYYTVANISCETGFEYFGDSQIVCNATGHWSGEANCTIKDCGNLTVENGEVTIVDNRTTFNASTYIQCHIGYNIIGNTSVCNASGHWSVEPICEITDCGILTKPMNGTVETDSNSTTYLSTANFSCDKGFYLSEKGVSTCESDGNWTHIPTCEIYDCGNLTIKEHGTVYLTNNLTMFNSSATFSCDHGYELTTENYSECNSSGKWTNKPQCKIRDCGNLTIENGEVTLVNNKTTVNASANIQCHIGYDIIGNTQSICNESGHWTVEPICKIEDCGLLEIINGTVSLGDGRTSYNTTANISCETGFEYFGDSQIVCNATGHWSGEANCTIKDCGYLNNPAHGRVVIANNVTTYQSTANFTCDEGFHLDGGVEIAICRSNGTWSSKPTCKLQDCGNLTIKEHGTVHLTNNLTTFNSTATFACDIGYKLTTDNKSSCNSSGKWSNDPQCEIRDCGEPDVQHATFILSKENITTYGSIVTFTCLPGYDLNGTRNATCDQFGQWTGLPTCVAKDCEKITAPTNGNVTLSNSRTTYGSQAIFTCDKGYKLTNDAPAVCNSSGQWTRTPSCKIIDCLGLSEPQNGHVYLDNDTTTYGSFARYECLPGYLLSGSNIIHCESSGNWSDIPTCNIKDCGFWSNNATNMKNNIAVNYENNQTYRSTATAECIPGYHVNGSIKTKVVAVCQHDAKWSAFIPMCVKTVCHDINVTDSNVKHDKMSIPYPAHTTIRFTCPDGYNIKGFQDLTCLSSSQWSHDVPTCVKVAAGVPSCEKNDKWESAKPGTTLMMDICPDGYEGSITRQCSEKGEWMQPINRCVNKDIIQMKDTVECLPDNITDPLKVTDVLLKLESISNPDQSGHTANTIQDFTELTSTLSSLVTKSGVLNVSETQSKPFLDTTSNILDVLCSISCGKDKSSSEESSERETKATSQLLETVNQYTHAVARSLNKTNNYVTIPAKNLVMHVRRIKDTDKEVIFPTEEDRVNVTSSVSIPHASLEKLTDGKISVVIYDNLNTILSTSAVQNGTKYTGINSQVMAVNLKGWQKNPEFKLNMTFNHFNQTSKTAGIPHCSFFVEKSNSKWNTTGCKLVKSASNSNTSVCECEHLTNFAILMSPWIPPSDAAALDIISIIGCSLSLLGLLVTMIMHLALWRYLKSDRVVILMNLCLALIISYSIFLGGVDQTQNKDACTVVAVLLQYIYLVVFFLMLAEAIELAVTVLYVFSTSSRLKWLIPLAWFLPAMITGVSVGSSQLEGYGNEQFCWLSVEDGLIWAFVAPAFTIIIVNLVLLVLVMKAMFNAQTLAQKSLYQRTKTGVRCLCVLLPLMGITWVIGIFYVNKETVWIQYVFAVCNSLQGLVIFIFHCALNTQIRRAVRRKHKQYTDSMQISKSTTFSLPKVGIRNLQNNAAYDYMTEIVPDNDNDWRISAHERNSSSSRESYGGWVTPKSSVL